MPEKGDVSAATRRSVCAGYFPAQTNAYKVPTRMGRDPCQPAVTLAAGMAALRHDWSEIGLFGPTIKAFEVSLAFPHSKAEM